MSEILELKKEQEIVTVTESYPLVVARINENFERTLISIGQSFSEQMFDSGHNKYVQSYTEVTEPKIEGEWGFDLNEGDKSALPRCLPGLISWIYCEKHAFNVRIGAPIEEDKVIPLQDRGLFLYPSFVSYVSVEATAKQQYIRYGSLSVPLQHKDEDNIPHTQ